MPSARVVHLVILLVLGAPVAARAADAAFPEPASAQQDGAQPSAPAVERSLDWAAVPLASYDADAGFGLGAAANFQWLGEVEPYRSQLTLQLLVTPGGLQSHWVTLDAPHVLGTRLRLWAHAEYIAELHSPYFGIGNQAPDARGAGDRTIGFDKQAPMLRAGVSWPLGQSAFGFGFVTAQQVSVRAHHGSRLERDRPVGYEGGFAPSLTLGIYRDGRDREINPSRGTYVEASARGQGPGADFPYFGVNASGRVFVPIGDRVVLASRLIIDWESAGAPFWELGRFGGLELFEGLGGAFSQRGITTKRYIGRLKTVGTVELRSHLFDAYFAGGPVSFGLVGFTDVGRVWQFAGNDGPFGEFHPAYGFGLRLWRRAFVVRVDLGFSRERGVAPYVLFGNLF